MYRQQQADIFTDSSRQLYVQTVVDRYTNSKIADRHPDSSSSRQTYRQLHTDICLQTIADRQKKGDSRVCM